MADKYFKAKLTAILMKRFSHVACMLTIVFFLFPSMTVATKPSGNLTDAEKLAQFEEQLRAYQAEYFHRYMLAYNDNLILTRDFGGLAPELPFSPYTYITVTKLANAITFEYLFRNTPVEKINEKVERSLKLCVRTSNGYKNMIKKHELPRIQKLIDSTKKRIEEIESSSQESAVRIKHLRREIDRRNEYIKKLDRNLKDKDFIFFWWGGESGLPVGGLSTDKLRSLLAWGWFEQKLKDPSYRSDSEFIIKIIAQSNGYKALYRDHVIPELQREIDKWTKEIAAIEAQMQRESTVRIEGISTNDAPPPKSAFNGQWRIYYQGWYVIEIQESHGEVSGEIWHESDTKRGDGSLSGKRLDNLVIGRAPPQDGIKGEFEMVKEIQEYDREEKKYYPALVQHDFKSFKFRIEDGNKLRGELCFRAKGGGVSLCRSVNGEKVK